MNYLSSFTPLKKANNTETNNMTEEGKSASPPSLPSSKSSLESCISLFTQPEQLDEKNPWFCGFCKEHKQATKEMSIYKTAK